MVFAWTALTRTALAADGIRISAKSAPEVTSPQLKVPAKNVMSRVLATSARLMECAPSVSWVTDSTKELASHANPLKVASHASQTNAPYAKKATI